MNIKTIVNLGISLGAIVFFLKKRLPNITNKIKISLYRKLGFV
jgi:hypothetical protein